jgi:hypothetical protein
MRDGWFVRKPTNSTSSIRQNRKANSPAECDGLPWCCHIELRRTGTACTYPRHWRIARIADLALLLANRVQLTSDGHRSYLEAVEESFGADIDYAMLVKIYGEPTGALGRYSPGECVGAEKPRVEGKPDPDHISTSYAERQNLSMRMGMRRFTRLTNAFSKKAENHAHGVAIYFMHYNFVRIHSTLRCSPAMAAGVTTKLWELADMAAVLEEWEHRSM